MNEKERVEWGTRKYGVRMSPAHILGMLDELTTLVEERWCTPYRRSGHFSALNPKMQSVGQPRARWDGLSRERRMR
jgi:hypothetical protein